MTSQAKKEIDTRKATSSNSSRSNSSNANLVAENPQSRLLGDPAVITSSTQEGNEAPSSLTLTSRPVTRSMMRNQAQSQICAKPEDDERPKVAECAKRIMHRVFHQGATTFTKNEEFCRNRSPESVSCQASPVSEMVKKYEERLCSSSKGTMSSPYTHRRSNSAESTSLRVSASVMVTQTKTLEEQLADLRQVVQERNEYIRTQDEQIRVRDAQLEQLMQKIELLTARFGEKSTSKNSPQKEKVSENLATTPTTSEKPHQTVGKGVFSMETIKQMVEKAVQNLQPTDGLYSTSQAYIRPYTRRIQAWTMPFGYKPSKFQQFNRNGNPKQHIAHFIETCNNVGTEGDLMVKQFSHFLKGNAFDWFVELPSESIDSWQELESEFLSRFYSTRRNVTLVELTNTKQHKGEKVVDYISRWRNLSLNCKESSSLSIETEIQMCTQEMKWGLLYFLQS